MLARNPALADLLLSWALGDAGLEPLDDSASESLREERLGAALPSAMASARIRRRFVLVGVWLALAHLVLGLVLCLTVIGIPLGLGNVKLAAAISALGKENVPGSNPGAQHGALSF